MVVGLVAGLYDVKIKEMVLDKIQELGGKCSVSKVQEFVQQFEEVTPPRLQVHGIGDLARRIDREVAAGTGHGRLGDQREIVRTVVRTEVEAGAVVR